MILEMMEKDPALFEKIAKEMQAELKQMVIIKWQPP